MGALSRLRLRVYRGKEKGRIVSLLKGQSTVGAASSRETLVAWVKKRQRKEKRYFVILLFLDEKKQKSSD
jgi:hypothetical protein